MKKLTLLLPVILLALAGCKTDKPQPVDKLAQHAQAVAHQAAAATLDPHEIDNIKRRRELMGKPGLQLYVVFLNDMGQPVKYFVTDGKCTSSDKRLINPKKAEYGDRGSYYGYFAVPARGADGTFGSSDKYTYCKTVDGKYEQWNGDIYISSAPINLTIKPLIVEMKKPGKSGIQSQG